MHAYVSDTADPGARYVYLSLIMILCTHSYSYAYPSISSRIFSLFLGLMFTGVALGPTLGGLLIRVTNNVLSVFYASAILHLIYATFTWIIIPESLSRRQMVASRARHQEEIRLLKEAREGIAVGLLVRIRRLFGFLSPLTMFMPVYVKGHNPLKVYKKRDWNLTLVAAGYALTIMIMVGLFQTSRVVSRSSFVT